MTNYKGYRITTDAETGLGIMRPPGVGPVLFEKGKSVIQQFIKIERNNGEYKTEVSYPGEETHRLSSESIKKLLIDTANIDLDAFKMHANKEMGIKHG